MVWKSASPDYPADPRPYAPPGRASGAHCTKCGTKLAASHKFCPGCGTPRRQPQHHKNQCTCGTIFSPDDCFCESCGTPRPR